MAKQKDFSKLSIKGLYESAINEFEEELLWHIENIYETAIEMFYNDYNPLWYQRTMKTYEASSGANNLYSPENIMPDGEDFDNVGIDVGAENIPGHPYRADKEWVFHRTFYQGIHGINSRAYFEKKRDRMFMRGIGRPKFTLIRGVSKKNKKGEYVTRYTEIQKTYREVRVRYMNNMTPTPKGIVEQQFKKLTGRRNLDRMFNSILMSKIEQL